MQLDGGLPEIDNGRCQNFGVFRVQRFHSPAGLPAIPRRPAPFNTGGWQKSRFAVAVAAVIALIVVGCGSGDPSQSVADRLISHQLVDLDQLCGQKMVSGSKHAEQWLLHDIYSGGGRSYAESHIFTNGATPNAVASDLLSRCLPDGGWK